MRDQDNTMSDQAGKQATCTFFSSLQQNLETLRKQGLYKPERVLASRQGTDVVGADGRHLINICANNYLGLSGDLQTQQAAIEATEQYGYGLSSVRFICGTQAVHKELEQAISTFLGMQDTILYAAAFDANGGLFEPLFDEDDAIISDALNHASIIDGIRLCKAARYRYRNNDMDDLESQLPAAHAAGKRHKVIATDGVFSMDGTIARLDAICDLTWTRSPSTASANSPASACANTISPATASMCAASATPASSVSRHRRAAAPPTTRPRFFTPRCANSRTRASSPPTPRCR